MQTRTAPQITSETQYLREVLYTDSIIWEIVGRTAKTLKLRRTVDTDNIDRDFRSGSPYPVVSIEQAPDPTGRTITVRLRKDGTYRVGNGSVLRPVQGTPTRRVDYRY